MRGFSVLKDKENPINKIIHSRLNDFSSTISRSGFSLKYVVEGTENYEIENKELVVNAGEYLLVNHNQKVRAHINASRPVKGLCIYIDPSWVNEAYQMLCHDLETLLDEVGQTEKTSFTEMTYPASADNINNLLTAIAGQGQLSPFNNEAFYSELALAVAQQELQTRKAIRQLQSNRRSTQLELLRRLYRAKAFIHDNYTRPIKLDDIARAACLSSFHFLRSFKQAFGKTPSHYLSDIRIEKAREQLGDRHLSITDIALCNGFSDYQYFSKCFKKKTGLPPSAYRKAMS